MAHNEYLQLPVFLFVSSIPPRVCIVKVVFTYSWYDGTPADYPLVTEVDATTGYIELTHNGPTIRDIGNWTVATAAGVVTLPSPTLLIPETALVVASDAESLERQYGTVANQLILPDLVVGGEYGYIRLMAGNRTVDHVAWGEAEPGWRLPGPATAPLCRPDAGRDTNTYLDWTASAQGSPGDAGCGS